MRSSFKLFLVAWVIVAVVLGLVSLPYSLEEIYGVRIRELRILVEVVVFVGLFLALLHQRSVKHRQTGKRTEDAALGGKQADIEWGR